MRQDRPTTTILFITVFFFFICAFFNHITPSEWFQVGAFISTFGVIIAFFVALVSAFKHEHPEPVMPIDEIHVNSTVPARDDEDD